MLFKTIIIIPAALLLLRLASAISPTPGPSDNVTHGHSHGLANETVADGHHGVSLASWRIEEYQGIFYFTLILLLACLLKISFHHVPKLMAHMPESCILIILGFLLGWIIHVYFQEESKTFPSFTETLFFNVLLPPIVLDASYSMYDEDFFNNLDAILIFAVIGTLLNVFLVAGLLSLVHLANLLALSTPFSFIQSLIFGSIISAVDPVAVLAIFEEIHVNSVLYFLVFGESLLNDGIVIVLYNTFIALNEQAEIFYTDYLLAFFSFFTVVFGGLLIGICVGALTSIVLRLTKGESVRVLEPFLIMTSAYFAYILAEILHWSGLICLIACGIMHKRYAFFNASKKTYTTVKYGVRTLASISESMIFIFLGKVAVNLFGELQFHAEFVAWTLFFCTIVRFIVVFILSEWVNLKRMKPISWAEQFIIAYGGLRGAVGFSLVYILSQTNELRSLFLTTTLIVIFFTVFVQGGTIKFMVKKLHIKRKSCRERKHIIEDVTRKTCDYLMAGVESIVGSMSIGSYFHIIKQFDDKYIKKFLLRKRVLDRMTMRLERITLDEHYARLYGPAVIASAQEKDEDIPESNLEDIPESEPLLTRVKTPPSYGVDDQEARLSLNRAFSISPYENFKQGPTHSDNEDFQSKVLNQLNMRSLHTKQLEKKLAKLAHIDLDDVPEDEELPHQSTELERRRKRQRWQSSGHTKSLDEDEAIPMSQLRRRTRTVTADDVRKQYALAKKRYKSFQN